MHGAVLTMLAYLTLLQFSPKSSPVLTVPTFSWRMTELKSYVCYKFDNRLSNFGGKISDRL